MKNLIITCFLLIVIIDVGCKKKSDPEPAANYDVTNKVFRTYVNSNSALLNVTISQIRPSAAHNPYGSIQAQQYSTFDYGFIPTVGDSINVTIKSAGPMFVGITYVGDALPVTTKSIPGGGTTASFGYMVKN